VHTFTGPNAVHVLEYMTVNLFNFLFTLKCIRCVSGAVAQMCVTEPLEGLDDVTIKMKSFATSSSTTATSVHSQTLIRWFSNVSTLSYFSAGTPICIVPSQPSVEIFSQIIPYTPLCCTLVLSCTQQNRLPAFLLSLSSTVGSATSFILMFQCYGHEITIIPKYSLPHCREHWNRTKDSLGSWADHGIKRMCKPILSWQENGSVDLFWQVWWSYKF